jgi:hypothetical protein
VKDAGVLDTGVIDTGVVDTGDPCQSCVDGACGAEEAACGAEPACVQTFDCLNACADATCANGCVSKFGSKSFMPFYQCVVNKCATACGG